MSNPALIDRTLRRDSKELGVLFNANKSTRGVCGDAGRTDPHRRIKHDLAVPGVALNEEFEQPDRLGGRIPPCFFGVVLLSDR
jgi:hypothetical protein